jgi:hypothetical protein
MASFLNDKILDAITNSLFRMHDTFSRKIYVFSNPEKTVIATNPNYNGLYKRNTSGSRDDIKNKMVVKEFMARVYYATEDQEYLAGEGSDQHGTQNKIILPKGSVRIVVTLEAYLIIKEARRVDLDGRVFAVKSGGNHSGFPKNQFYHFHLTPTDE